MICILVTHEIGFTREIADQIYCHGQGRDWGAWRV